MFYKIFPYYRHYYASEIRHWYDLNLWLLKHAEVVVFVELKSTTKHNESQAKLASKL